MNKLLMCFFTGSLILSCGTNKNHTFESDVNKLKSVMESRLFEFRAEWANPMASQGLYAISNAGLLPPGSNVGAIQITGTNNFLKIQGDTITANLPYFGERRLGGGGYGDNTGIEFNGVPNAYNQAYNPEKNRLEISFEIADKTEDYDVRLTIFPNKNAGLSVNSNQRNSIRYTGAVVPMKKESE